MEVHHGGRSNTVTSEDELSRRPLDVGLRRDAPGILNGELRIEILPLRKNAPIYMAKSARPDGDDVASLESIETVYRYRTEFTSP
ncbi:MAG TPA: hypothetical protein VGN61_05485 [Verrucomicrobiae bacterium]